MLDLKNINNEWTLFLDRDGVINKEPELYVLNVKHFFFYDGVLEALKYLNGKFGHIVVATNQRGVGRKLMTETDLTDIHDFMLEKIHAAGGRIDKIYYCTSMDNNHPDRKPNPGMAMEAMKDFPEISMQQSIMVGNNLSDMSFGRNAGMHTVLITGTGTDVTLPHPLVDLKYNSLPDFANAIRLA